MKIPQTDTFRMRTEKFACRHRGAWSAVAVLLSCLPLFVSESSSAFDSLLSTALGALIVLLAIYFGGGSRVIVNQWTALCLEDERGSGEAPLGISTSDGQDSCTSRKTQLGTSCTTQLGASCATQFDTSEKGESSKRAMRRTRRTYKLRTRDVEVPSNTSRTVTTCMIVILFAASAVTGAAATMVSLDDAGESIAFNPSLLSIIYVLLLACVTGIFEEGVFRLFLPDVFVRAFHSQGTGYRSFGYAAVFSGFVFALLHIEISTAASLSLMMVVSVVLKCIQSMLFSLLLQRFLISFGYLKASIVHAIYDAVYFAPLALFPTSDVATYLVSNPAYIGWLTCSVIALAFALILDCIDCRAKRCEHFKPTD